MPEIGIRELKTRASEILRNVRQRKIPYVITHRGRPVGLLTPIEEPAADSLATETVAWDELTRLGQEIARVWPQGISSADVLSEMRG
jgi:prevent-host-death family protein